MRNAATGDSARMNSELEANGLAWIGWIPLIVLPGAALACRARLAPWIFMWTLAGAIFFGCKWQAREMLRGDRSAFGSALFIGIYWALRIAVDFFYYDRQDWPRGKGFVFGHILLTSLFAYLAISNLGLVIWKVWT